MTVLSDGLNFPDMDFSERVKKITMAGILDTASSMSSGISNRVIFDMAMMDQCRMKIYAKKLIFSLKVISMPSM